MENFRTSKTHAAPQQAGPSGGFLDMSAMQNMMQGGGAGGNLESMMKKHGPKYATDGAKHDDEQSINDG